MVLSDELIQEFVKATKQKNSAGDRPSSHYGTIVEYDDRKWVRLDGSDLLTPIATVANIVNDERVLVSIQGHQAIVTGNLSSPSARHSDLEAVSGDVLQLGYLIADKVSVQELEANYAKIEYLESHYITVDKLEADYIAAIVGEFEGLTAKFATIDNLNATNATIENLDSKFASIETLESTYATIENLNATNIKVNDLVGTYGTFQELTTNNFEAINATIKNLDSTYAKIGDLEATNATVGNLTADVADINTLIFGSATGDVIHVDFANAVISQLGDAQIKSAMIESVSAGKITAGDIITNNVRVLSEDGSLLISDETIQISDDNRVRVQIGKDASNDYSINIWDADGNLMFSEGGISESAIKDSIIRNDMVSETANISASKLDIDSLFTEINGSSNTIKSTKIYLDENKQTLDVAFKSMTTTVNGVNETISSQGTQITIIQGQISNKIWQQDINTAKSELNGSISTLSTQYSDMNQTLTGLSSTVASHKSLIDAKADGSTVTTIGSQVTSLEQNLTGFKTTVSNTYTTKTEFANLEIGGRNLVHGTGTGTGWTTYDGFNAEDREFVRKATTTAERIMSSPNCFDLVAGETYTLSFKAKQNGHCVGGEIYILPKTYESTGIAYNNTFSVNTTYKEYVYTFTPSTKATNLEDCVLRFDNNGSKTSGTEAILYVKDIKLEKGNKATDWTPAPEDMATTNSVSALSTKIEQTDESISLVAERTTDAEKAITELSLTADGLTVDLGGVRDTANAAKKIADSTAKRINTNLRTFTKANWQNYGAEGHSENWTTGSSYDNSHINVGDTAYIVGKVSDAGGSNDVYATIYGTVTAVVPAHVAMTSLYYIMGGEGGAYALANSANTAAANAQSTANSASTAASNAQSTANSASTAASNAQADINNLSVGGRNLVAGTSKTTEYSGNTGGSIYKDVWTAQTIDIPTGTEYVVSFDAKAAVAQEITCYFYSPNTTTKALSSTGQTGTGADGSCKVTLTTSWKRYWVKWTQTAATAKKNIIVGRNYTTNNIYIRAVKFEEGNRATSWSPAPEDVDTGISNAAKTATNFMSYDATNGLLVGNKTSGSWVGNRAQITSDAFNILNSSGTQLASFGTTATIGQSTSQNVYIDSDSVDIRKGTSVLASFKANQIDLGLGGNSGYTISTINLCGGAGSIVGKSLTGSTVFDQLVINSDSLQLNADNVHLGNRYQTNTCFSEVHAATAYNVDGAYDLVTQQQWTGEYAMGTVSSSCRNDNRRSGVATFAASSAEATPYTQMYAVDANNNMNILSIFPSRIEINDIDINRIYPTFTPKGTAIAENSNLNTATFLKIGNYYCSKNDTVKTFTNCPTASAFMMQVYSPLSNTYDNESTGTWVYRLRKMMVYTGEEYSQYVYSGSTKGSFTYGPWKKVVKTGEAVTLTDLTVSTSSSNTDALTVNGNSKFIGNFQVTGTTQLSAIELYRATPYIDFHFGNSTADYTLRLIEEASGVLSVRGNGVKLFTPNDCLLMYDSGNTDYPTIFRPNTNGKCLLGAVSYRWHTIYSSNGTIQTSDGREKEDIISLGNEHSELFDRLKPVQYKFIDGNGRTCYGLIAQEVVEAMEELGIGENELDLIHHDTWIDEETNEVKDGYGLAYTNLIAMLIHEVQKLKQQVKEIKS